MRPIPRTARFSDPDHCIWCGTMVRDAEGVFHLYYSRWPRRLGHFAWVTHSEVAHAVAEDPLGPYRHVDVALPPRGLEYWDGICTHNPTVHFFEGRYYLYYMGVSASADFQGKIAMEDPAWWVYRNSQRIGVAVANSPYGPWRRLDQPLIDASVDPSAPDALMVANPSIARRPDGVYVFVYKAVGKKRPAPFRGPVVHLVATGNSPVGPFIKHPDPVFTSKGSDFPAEDPYIWFQPNEGRFYAIVKDMEGSFTGHGRSLALFQSDEGIQWSAAANPFVAGLTIQWDDGEEERLAHLERPQLWHEGGEPKVLFLAAAYDPNHSFNLHVPLCPDLETAREWQGLDSNRKGRIRNSQK